MFAHFFNLKQALLLEKGNVLCYDINLYKLCYILYKIYACCIINLALHQMGCCEDNIYVNLCNCLFCTNCVFIQLIKVEKSWREYKVEGEMEKWLLEMNILSNEWILNKR